VRVGDSPERFLARYERAIGERDEARLLLERGVTEKEALYDFNIKLKKDNEQKGRALRDERERVAQLEQEGKQLKAQSEAKIAELDAKLDEQLNQVESYKSGVLARRYNRTWYVAAGGLIVSGLLGLGLVVALARGRDEDDADRATPPAPKPSGGESPHEIT
jgi:predicted nuclease with TOPRIM domain